MSDGNEAKQDPRVRLVRDKYFSIRPRPLERWLWAQGIPASAERVFWVHWQEGVQRGDWCSEIPLRRVARECSLDVSTVTRAYQVLAKLGCIRRTDPGRDAANPFQQAIAVTEVRLPRELLGELNRHPNRRAGSRVAQECRAGRDIKAGGTAAEISGTNESQRAADPLAPAAIERSAASDSDAKDNTLAPDPFAGLSGRERARALAQLTQAMSASERNAYQAAMRLHRISMDFDADSKVSEEARAAVLQVLSSMAAVSSPVDGQVSKSIAPGKQHQARCLSVFELARLKGEIQKAGSSSGASPDLLRQVVWSIEAGALRRFSPLHAIHIALKKIREGAWTRPHRMPPNWMRGVRAGAGFETCSAA